ncbi:MAG: hypothetical protein KA028_02190 [Candidatus Pacebacteria bacterium]|nr:hypothetical protein [Candidatus Paceibacterota bacterium]MBP9852079.1 hypothetical protein [Candidatus Paceibacterota bacterium]
MAKNFLNDIRPARREDTSRVDDEPLEVSSRPVQLPPRFKERSFQHPPAKRSRKMLWIVVVLVILGGGIAVLSHFASAKVTIEQKAEDVTLDNSVFNATLVGDEKTLSFKLVKLSGSAEKVVTGGTPTTVTTKATGKVVLYNNFSSAPQKLAIDTRLETPDGKIYKTDVATTVPGLKTEAGKQVPGSVEVGVHADQAGPTYNIGLTDFTILGFKGSAKYTKFYGRSRTVMSGGASGMGIALSEADSKVAREAALSILREKLIAEAKASLPDSSILLPGAYVIKEDADSGQTVADKNVMIVKGSLYGILFDENELASRIADVAVSQYDGALITIPELDSFTVDIKNKETITDTTSTVSFLISGKGHAIWQVPVDQIVAKLMGSKKRDISANLSSFSSVGKASVAVMPFWSMSLPDKTESIHVVVEDPMAK